MPIYEGKKALIGNFLICSSNITKGILENLGFTVDVVPTIKKVIRKVKRKNTYDIIFTNNYYRKKEGKGIDCLNRLRKIKNFSTPVVVLTLMTNMDYFIDVLGFDGYLAEPVKQKDMEELLAKLLPLKEDDRL